MLFVVFRPIHINALTCRLVILYQGREPPSVSPLLCHMSLEMAASCRLLRRSLMHTFHNHWNLFAIISLLVNLATLPLTNAQERILVSYGGHNESVGTPCVTGWQGWFKNTGLDVRILQVRHSPVMLTALMSGEVQAFCSAV